MRRAQSLGRSSSPGFTHQPAPFPAGPRAGEALPNHAITTGPRQPGPGAGVRRAGAAAGPQGAHGEGGREAPPPPAPHPAAGRSPRPNGPGNSSRPCSASEVSRGTGHGAPLHRPAPRSRRRLPSAAALRRRLNERPPPPRKASPRGRGVSGGRERNTPSGAAPLAARAAAGRGRPRRSAGPPGGRGREAAARQRAGISRDAGMTGCAA